MNCPHCASAATKERTQKTTPGYRTFRCSDCKKTFNERTGTPFNLLEYPTDVVLLVVLWRLRYKLSLRDLAELVCSGLLSARRTSFRRFYLKSATARWMTPAGTIIREGMRSSPPAPRVLPHQLDYLPGKTLYPPLLSRVIRAR